MESKTLLLWMLLFLVQGSTGDVVLTQSPGLLTVSLGQKATISCQVQFSGSGSGTYFTFIIIHVEADDAATYYCQQSRKLPPTVLQG
ncbi:hypothetical protein U0070_002809 [Myodes glareolus]|uniref:Immunoglobulin domain-containing protein n=1 Tax=Myodes glareolus TaxID=447135 RepID=A0AAW0H1Y6_MYOGA